MAEEKRTFCRVCEPACGMIASIEDGQIVAMKPDKEHPVTKGFVCHKGIYGLDIHNDPDRLRVPLRKAADGSFEEATWEEVIPEIAKRLSAIKDKHGREALGAYRGNPMAFNALFGPSYGSFMGQLGAAKHFSSGTQDCTNKFAGSEAVFGTQTMHPVPDIENTDYLLMLGENPAVSHMSFLSIADPMGTLRTAQDRGAKIVYINPRTIESARHAGEVVHIRPDTDVYFLASLLCEIERTSGFDENFVADHGRNVEQLRSFIAKYTPEKMAEVTGISAESVATMAREFTGAERASVHMSTGVNMGRQGTLAYWLVHMLSFVTGNLGRKGGNFYALGFYERAAQAGRARSEVADIIDGPFGPMRNPNSGLIGLPGNLMADYILNPEDPIKAMFVVGGNPVLSVGGEAHMREALGSLELLVCMDIYRSATAEYADYILPAAGAFEREDINITGLGMQYQPSIQFTEAMIEPQYERKTEWWVFEKLSQAMGFKSILDETETPDLWGRTAAMLRSRDLDMEVLKTDGIIVMDRAEPDDLLGKYIQTEDKRVDCYPASFDGAIERMDAILKELQSEPADQLKLITKRDDYMINSWYSNLPKMKRKERAKNYLFMHPEDGAKRQLKAGQEVKVSNEFGTVAIELKLTDDLMPGVVAMTHGWGHAKTNGMKVAQKTAGVNANVLSPSGPGSYEPLSNQAHMTGIRVDVASNH